VIEIHMANRRQNIPIHTKTQVLHEAGYMCANPVCRTVLTLDIHHMEYVSEGGSNSADNLLPLCPNCHALHHSGEIPRESIRTWKMLLLSLNEAFNRKAIDILLALDKLGWIMMSGDGLLETAPLVASGLVTATCHQEVSAGVRHVSYELKFAEKGRLFIDAWKRGDQRAAVNPPETSS